MEYIELKERVKEFIAKDELESAIQLLSDTLGDSERYDEIVVHSARYYRIRKDVINGAVSKQDLKKELNELRRNILEFIRLEESLQTYSEPIDAFKLYKTNFHLSLTRIKVAELLLAQSDANECFTITAILGSSRLTRRKLVVDALNEMLAMGLVEKYKHQGMSCWRVNEEGKKFFKQFDLA